MNRDDQTAVKNLDENWLKLKTARAFCHSQFTFEAQKKIT